MGPRVGPDRLLYERGVIAPYTGAIGWRSLVSASVWGTEGPEFKSRQPDKQIPGLNRRFAVSDHRGGLAPTPGNPN